MKIYRLDFSDPDLGTVVSWHSSEVAAKREFIRMKRERKKAGALPTGPEGVELIDLPTDKKGLINWLNQTIKTDNG